MAIFKPTVDSVIWSDSALSSPDYVGPGAGLIGTGFPPPAGTKPTRGHMNFMFRLFHNAVRYFSSRGIPDWDAAETGYVVGSVVFYATTGKFYRCFAAGVTGAAPSADTTHWKDLLLIPGVRLGSSRVTATGNVAVISGCARWRLYMIGCGGGGAGAYGTTNPDYTGGAGGASGSWAIFEGTTIPAANFAFTFGTAGTAGPAPGSPGSASTAGDGGDAVMSDGTNTFTCPGGKGAISTAGGLPGALPTAAPGGTILLATKGEEGGPGGFTAGSVGNCYSGKGGGSPHGPGGGNYFSSSFGNGKDGSGYGFGGGGAMSANTPFTGAVGGGAWALLEQYA